MFDKISGIEVFYVVIVLLFLWCAHKCGVFDCVINTSRDVAAVAIKTVLPPVPTVPEGADSIKAELETIKSAGQPEGFVNIREEPSSWEPSTAEFSRLGANTVFKSYPENISANVDAAIIQSHADYVSDMDFHSTTGSSHAATRDDFHPAVQFHGLPRKAHYRNVGATVGSRVAQSETPDTVYDIMEHSNTAYTL
jgi:hypothetical protein